MAIILVPQPGSTPSSLTDWTNAVESLKQYNLSVNQPLDYDFSGNTIKKGTQIIIGGSNYYCNADTAITGTASNYVKITSAGFASYVASLSGVSWNNTYNFYADVSGNAYIFNEGLAVFLGTVTAPKTKWGKNALHAYVKDLSLSGQLTVSTSGITSSSTTVNISKPVIVNGSGEFNGSVLVRSNITQQVPTNALHDMLIWKNNAGDTRFKFQYDAQNIKYNITDRNGDPIISLIEIGKRTLLNGATDDGTTTLNANGNIRGNLKTKELTLVDGSTITTQAENLSSILDISSANVTVTLNAPLFLGQTIILKASGIFLGKIIGTLANGIPANGIYISDGLSARATAVSNGSGGLMWDFANEVSADYTVGAQRIKKTPLGEMQILLDAQGTTSTSGTSGIFGSTSGQLFAATITGTFETPFLVEPLFVTGAKFAGTGERMATLTTTEYSHQIFSVNGGITVKGAVLFMGYYS